MISGRKYLKKKTKKNCGIFILFDNNVSSVTKETHIGLDLTESSNKNFHIRSHNFHRIILQMEFGIELLSVASCMTLNTGPTGHYL